MHLPERIVGYSLSVGVIATAAAGFPIALGAGIAMYVALHHTKSGRAWFDLMDTLADDAERQAEEQEAAA